MHVLCLSSEAAFLGHVATAFADRITSLKTLSDPDEFIAAANDGTVEIFLIDFDQLHLKYADPVAFIRKMPAGSRVLVIGSLTFADWHQPLQDIGTAILHKPTAIAEVGLVLRRLIAEASRENRS